MQKLVLPYTYCEILAGYKTAAYLREWGYYHYGWDLYSFDHPDTAQRGKIYASGAGTVALAGRDPGVGNVVVVVYPDAYIHGLDKTAGLTARYYHLASIAVQAGQQVTADTLLGVEGNTGTSGVHLHVEWDTDTQYPAYSPQVAKRADALIKKGTDSTVDPVNVFYRRGGGVIVPSRYGVDWNGIHDMELPALEAEPSGIDYQALAESLSAQLEAAQQQLATAESEAKVLREKIVRALEALK
jgi:hypothetical protein